MTAAKLLLTLFVGAGFGATASYIALSGQVEIVETERNELAVQNQQLLSEIDAITTIDRLDIAVKTASSFVNTYRRDDIDRTAAIDVSRLLEREIESVKGLDDLSPDRQARAQRAITDAEDLILDIEFQ